MSAAQNGSIHSEYCQPAGTNGIVRIAAATAQIAAISHTVAARAASR